MGWPQWRHEYSYQGERSCAQCSALQLRMECARLPRPRPPIVLCARKIVRLRPSSLGQEHLHTHHCSLASSFRCRVLRRAECQGRLCLQIKCGVPNSVVSQKRREGFDLSFTRDVFAILDAAAGKDLAEPLYQEEIDISNSTSSDDARFSYLSG